MLLFLILFISILFLSLASFSKKVVHARDPYLSKIYPNSSQLTKPEIEFIYSFAPRDKNKKYFDPEKERNYSPPEFNWWWRPVWYAPNTFSLNLYPPRAWWNYRDLNKYPSDSFVEGVHVRDDNPFYSVYGYWIYKAPGSGVFYNVGKTLLARNKIHALFLLGMDAAEIADLLRDERYYYNPDRPSEEYYGGMKSIESILQDGKNYNLDRFNNTAAMDRAITTRARAQGYDSVQFQIQANGMGGWAHEIVFVSPTPLLKKREKTWPGWTDMKKRMELRDPDGIKPPLPCIPVLNKLVTCAQQAIHNRES